MPYILFPEIVSLDLFSILILFNISIILLYIAVALSLLCAYRFILYCKHFNVHQCNDK